MTSPYVVFDVSVLYKTLLIVAIPLLLFAIYMGLVLTFLRKVKDDILRKLLKIVLALVGAGAAMYLMLFSFQTLFPLILNIS